MLVTGLLEPGGAGGLLLKATRFWPVCGLILLMAAMLPADVSATRPGLELDDPRVTPLWLRVTMQIRFMLWAWYVRQTARTRGLR